MIQSVQDDRITDRQNNFLRLRTLITLRWWACAGQFSALLVAQNIFELQLQYDLCFAVIGISVIINAFARFIYPEAKRLSERQIRNFVLFDLLQLGGLLYLTGGLNNPFSILIVGPVTVSAAALRGRQTIALAAVAILIVLLLIEFHHPLRSATGDILGIRPIFRFGNGLAIIIALVFQGFYSYRMISEMRAMSNALQATQMALAREQKLTDLGGVVAAAAHELGTPLATIKLTSSELVDELDDETLRQDALLIREQADRCRDILREMGRVGKDDPHIHTAPLSAVIDEAAEPHMNRGKQVLIKHQPIAGYEGHQPHIYRKAEIIHGLRNLVQNAVDFSRTTVWIESQWDDTQISIRIMDNGRGYPPYLLGRIGEPFIRPRAYRTDPNRAAYDGMGLGLFIAKTLLERTGAELTFTNGRDEPTMKPDKSERTGAFVEVIWPYKKLAAPKP